MVKTVEAYEAEDGTTFGTLEEAEAYEKSLNVKANIEELLTEKYKGEKLPIRMRESVINFIVDNAEEIKNLI